MAISDNQFFIILFTVLPLIMTLIGSQIVPSSRSLLFRMAMSFMNLFFLFITVLLCISMWKFPGDYNIYLTTIISWLIILTIAFIINFILNKKILKLNTKRAALLTFGLIISFLLCAILFAVIVEGSGIQIYDEHCGKDGMYCKGG
jgi:hypothetical protein